MNVLHRPPDHALHFYFVLDSLLDYFLQFGLRIEEFLPIGQVRSLPLVKQTPSHLLFLLGDGSGWFLLWRFVSVVPVLLIFDDLLHSLLSIFFLGIFYRCIFSVQIDADDLRLLFRSWRCPWVLGCPFFKQRNASWHSSWGLGSAQLRSCIFLNRLLRSLHQAMLNVGVFVKWLTFLEERLMAWKGGGAQIALGYVAWVAHQHLAAQVGMLVVLKQVIDFKVECRFRFRLEVGVDLSPWLPEVLLPDCHDDVWGVWCIHYLILNLFEDIFRWFTSN